MNEFKSYHPIVNFTYFLCVIGFSMFFTNPICLAVSIICSISCSVMLGGISAFRKNMLIAMPILLFTALLNPIISHEGTTIISYLPSGNPLTLEAIRYGWAAGAIIASVIIWFSCYNAVMTSDKFIYLFGKIMPSMSLLLSMTLRFVPGFSKQLKEIVNSQRCIGRDISNGGIISRAAHGLSIISIMVTRALENSVETADSMKARGYGLPNRTAFFVFRFDRRDLLTFLYIIILGIYILTGYLSGGISYQYFPSSKPLPLTPYSISIYTAYILLCITPVFIEICYTLKFKENNLWKATK